MQKPTIVKTSNPAQLIATLPALVGYQPHESLVIMPMRRRRSVGALRIDLPCHATAQHPESESLGTANEIANWVVATLCRIPDVDSFTAVIFTEAAPLSSADELPQLELIQRLKIAGDASGFRLCEALLTTGEAWFDYLDDDRGPHELLAPEQITNQHSGAELENVCEDELKKLRICAVLLEQVLMIQAQLHSDRETLPDSAQLRAQNQIFESVSLSELDTLIKDFDYFDAQELEFADLAKLLLERGTELPPAWVVYFQFWMRIDTFRNGLLYYCLIKETPDAFLGAVDGYEQLIGGELEHVDIDRLEQLLALFKHLAARAVHEQDGPILLAVCAWLSWALGSATHAVSYAEEALNSNPELLLAQVTQQLALHAKLPNWLFNEASARSAAAQ